MLANHRKKSTYRNPPKDTRFKKGQSGNPSGRPKGRPNLATVLERTLRETVVVTESGRRKVITKLEAATRQLVDKAASGDLRALQHLMALARSADERSPEAGAPACAMAELDRKVLEGVLSRLGTKNL
jgi:hypothetical protein